MFCDCTDCCGTATQADADVSAAAMFPDSGLFFLGGEQSKVMSYFVPTLGPAPKWCGYLDTIADELQDDEQPVVYDDFKFVTREDLDRLGLKDLMGTGMLRAHMHGFFVDARLYNEAVEALNPFAHEEYRFVCPLLFCLLLHPGDSLYVCIRACVCVCVPPCLFLLVPAAASLC